MHVYMAGEICKKEFTPDMTFLHQVLTLFEGVIDIEQCQMVSIDVSKPHLGLICRLLSLRGADKTLWD